MKGNLLGLDLTILDFDLVSSQDNGDVFTDSSQITMPVGNIFVSDTRGDIKHDNGTLSLNVISITKSTKFLQLINEDDWGKDKEKREGKAAIAAMIKRTIVQESVTLTIHTMQ